MGSFLQEVFLHFSGVFRSWDGEQELDHPSCSGGLRQAIEHVVDETHRRLRFLPGYDRRLREPVVATFNYIDALVEEVPGAILCGRSSFSEDPRVSAFFVDPDHLRAVFSQNAQVHDLFDNDPTANECWALLCVRKEEHRQLGMSLVGDQVQRDVMQTVVNFVDHQIISPAASEAEAKCSLKSCIFNGLLGYIRKRESEDRIRIIELENRRNVLASRLNRAVLESSGTSREELQQEVNEIGAELAQEVPRLASLEYHFDLVADILRNPDRFVSGSLNSIHLSRLGIKLDGISADSGDEIPLYEIAIASQGTRVGTLVRFPRADLLPRQDFVHKVDLFSER